MVTIRWIAFFLSLIGLLVWSIWAKRQRPGVKLYSIIPLSWLSNVALFYSVRVLQIPIDIYIINTWSASLTIHALILLIGGGVMMIQDRRHD